MTLLIVAVSMFAMLSMAVLALDVVSLYVAKDQAQEAADAAALAGAEVLELSGTTSVPLSVPLSSVCNGSSAKADLWAQAVAAQNHIVGVSPTTVTTLCPTSAPAHNPYIRVTVSRGGLPTFFSRIWSGGAISVSATASAEAYNPSFDAANPGGPPIQIHGVKPWLVSNCNMCGLAEPLYFDSNYAIARGGSFIGQPVTLTLITSSTVPTVPGPPAPPAPPLPSPTAQFYALDGPAPLYCPSSSAVSCGQIGTGTPGLNYHDNIACENGFNFSNGQLVGPGQTWWVDTRSAGNLHARTIPGTTCLIHADTVGSGLGQDSFTVGLPVTITGGYNNPNPSLRLVDGIHRSDSVVTVPVFNCPSVGTCDGTAQLPIVGFLQLGIQDVTATGDLDAVILNAAGLDPASTGTPITGAGASPVPVRLIHQ
ncbi:MAG TPA: pilus assembly protein TadG-related protein [Terriglobales bacterium]|nr:pilus assembly protein TadG-related protein [Terriglobales bacterium]